MLADRWRPNLTPGTAEVLKIFLEDPLKSHYGFELMQITGLPSGVLYPMLTRLAWAQWLTVRKEDIDPHVAGRPARRFYKLNPAVIPAVRQQFAELSERHREMSERYRLPEPSVSTIQDSPT